MRDSEAVARILVAEEVVEVIGNLPQVIAERHMEQGSCVDRKISSRVSGVSAIS